MLGNRLKSVREENKYTQEQIAKYLGVNQNTISSWENNRTQPKLRHINALCSLYGCTSEHLTGVKAHDSGDLTLDEIVKSISTMTIEEITVVEQICKIVKEKELIRIATETPNPPARGAEGSSGIEV